MEGHVNLFTSLLSSSVMEVKKSSLCFEMTLFKGSSISHQELYTRRSNSVALASISIIQYFTKEKRKHTLWIQGKVCWKVLHFSAPLFWTSFGYTLKKEEHGIRRCLAVSVRSACCKYVLYFLETTLRRRDNQNPPSLLFHVPTW